MGDKGEVASSRDLPTPLKLTLLINGITQDLKRLLRSSSKKMLIECSSIMTSSRIMRCLTALKIISHPTTNTTITMKLVQTMTITTINLTINTTTNTSTTNNIHIEMIKVIITSRNMVVNKEEEKKQYGPQNNNFIPTNQNFEYNQ